MGWTYIAEAEGGTVASASTTDCSSTLHVELNDLLVCVVKYDGGDSTAAVASTVPDNAFTMLDIVGSPPYNLRTWVGYCIVATHDEAATFRFTMGAARERSSIVVMQFRPDAGDTVSLDDNDSGTGNDSSTAVTGNITTTGSDEVVVGCIGMNGGGLGNRQIADTAADAYDGISIDGQETSMWYKLFTSTQTDIHSQSTLMRIDGLATSYRSSLLPPPVAPSSRRRGSVVVLWLRSCEA